MPYLGRSPPPPDVADVRAEARPRARRDVRILEIERERELGAAQQREPAGVRCVTARASYSPASGVAGSARPPVGSSA